MQYPKPPPKPDEVRARQRATANRRDAYEDRAQSDFESQLGGDTREAFRMRQRERLNPGYTEARARQLDTEDETRFSRREAAQKSLLEKSIAFWGDGKEAAPAAPSPTAPTGGVSNTAPQAPRPQAAAPTVGDAAGALADVPWRKRRVAPQGMTRAAQAGELSRLLGI